MVDLATNGIMNGKRMNGEAQPLTGGLTTGMKVGTRNGSTKGLIIGTGKMNMLVVGRKKMMGLSRRRAA
eukprot:3701673-Karenia_brevis.AAC.1